jgi:hypothetical protein
LIVKYDWDFDNYLEEDVPAAVRWHFILLRHYMHYSVSAVNFFNHNIIAMIIEVW